MNLTALSVQVWLHAYAQNGITDTLSRYVFTTFTEAHFQRMLKDPDYRILVFTEDDHLLGYVAANLKSFWKSPANGYEVKTLYVQEHFQGRGIGRKLLAALEQHCGACFWLSTWHKNISAIAFYKHLGFEDLGQTYFELDGERHANRVLALNRVKNRGPCHR